MFIKFTRTFKAGLQNFLRNGLLSLATISVIIVTLFIVNTQVAVVAANDFLLKDVKDRVNISVYLKKGITQNEIDTIKKEIEDYNEVSQVIFVSEDQALDEFKEQNKDNETIEKALNELGENPLGAVINIRSDNPDYYESIASRIEGGQYAGMISKVNYAKYKGVINNLNQEIKSNQKIAIILAATLSLVAILVTFNSIRITMYSHRQEIEIMKLVGASNNYIRMPFIWEGIFYGLVAALVAIPLSYGYLDFISDGASSNSILPFSNTKYIKTFLTDYFFKNIFHVILFQFAFGIFLGVISSLIAIRKHLRV